MYYFGILYNSNLEYIQKNHKRILPAVKVALNSPFQDMEDHWFESQTLLDLSTGDSGRKSTIVPAEIFASVNGPKKYKKKIYKYS
jgi:hypothetical protein